MEKPSPKELVKVAYDNQRDNQIGGQTDGIDPVTARDLGYTLPGEVVDLVDRIEERENAAQLEADQRAIDAAKRAVEEDGVREWVPANLKNPNTPGREQKADQVMNKATFRSGADQARITLEKNRPVKL